MSNTDIWKRVATEVDALGHGLSREEFKHICDVLGRDINYVELGICSALFSEHCSYKSTKVHLKTLPTEGKRVLQGPGENAGVIDIDDGDAIVFKVESHNHPTFIEPFQGAATGVGGILRDVFTMGARPLALMNALRFGSPEHERVPYLLNRAVAGIGSYGNCMGIPTVGGELFFHGSYDGNCLVNAFALGYCRADQIFLGRASGSGNRIIYVGSKTGRDGIHGATMASESFEEDSEEKRPTVQVGDPFQEKLLLEACLEAMQTGAVVGIQDMGAAGMTSSLYEMADRAGSGVRVELDKVPQREEGMSPYEIMLSESQERMVLVVDKDRVDEVLKIFTHWELDAVDIGEVTDSGDVELLWKGELISSIPAEVLVSSVPKYRWPEKEPESYSLNLEFDCSALVEPEDLSSVWLKLLSSENLCSRQAVYSQYDSTVRTNTVIHPGGDAAVIRLKSKANPLKGVAMTLDCNSRYCGIDPRQGAALSVVEAFRNLTAVGAEPVGISDCLNFGSPETPTGMWQIAEGIRGLGEAARALSVPVISGNVSLYNETRGKAILATPMVAMVGLVRDVSKAVPSAFQREGDIIYLLGQTDPLELGGSEYLAQEFNLEKGSLPEINYDLELKTAKLVLRLINEGLICSCHDISSGGLAVALAECCFSETGNLGASLELKADAGRRDGLLFSESGARYIVSFQPENKSRLKELIDESGVTVSGQGSVGGNMISIKDIAELDLEQAYRAWWSGLDALFG
ncbi:MAG: phosphoribosylformylglycinamidine synthase subunit PurL [Candidatus Dadabacteria bacterium]|nr:MAG: phosphoribosylformylglycinamidine synthase subunit PurL [Candidatus Dadabacteria bacterium]